MSEEHVSLTAFQTSYADGKNMKDFLIAGSIHLPTQAIIDEFSHFHCLIV